MGMSDEQREAERARQRALRAGARDRVSDLKSAESRASKKAQRAISRADEKSSTKLTPARLYKEFKDIVRSKYPAAILAEHSDGRYLVWGKRLISNYPEEALREMVRVLVLDFENFAKAKIFLKFSGATHPTYEQFQSNAALLAGRVGVGVIAPPSVRFSAYAEDYNRRRDAAAGTGSVDDGKDKATVDPIQAIRDQVNG
jgi:hypothetical protein